MRIAVITTGGTIAKTYDEHMGLLRNERPVVESLIATLRLPDLAIDYRHLFSKDSLDLTARDREAIRDAVAVAAHERDAVIIIHGTDTLTHTGELIYRELPDLAVPVVLTGAMRPYEFRDSDGVQNVTEALLTCRLVEAGVYVAMHNRVLRFPGVVKDHETLTFKRR